MCVHPATCHTKDQNRMGKQLDLANRLIEEHADRIHNGRMSIDDLNAISRESGLSVNAISCLVDKLRIEASHAKVVELGGKWQSVSREAQKQHAARTRDREI